MLVAKDCLNLKLVKTAHAADDFIWVSGADAVKLNSLGVGNYINLTISDNRACETVRYDHVANWPATSAPKQLPVIRDVGATGRKNFGVNSCAVADWSVTQITEYIEQVAGGTAAIASLSTSTSTGLSAVNSSVASLSTSTSSAFSTSGESLTSLSTSTSTSLSAVNSSVASLSTSASTGLSAVNSSVASLSAAIAPLVHAPVHGTTTPTAPPAPGTSNFFTNDALGEQWLWNGEVWTLLRGAAVDDLGATGIISQGASLTAYTYTVPRDGFLSISGQMKAVVVQDPVSPYSGPIELGLARNGTQFLAAQGNMLDDGTGPGDGLVSSISYAVGYFQAGDVITMTVALASYQPGLTVSVTSTTFQALFQG